MASQMTRDAILAAGARALIRNPAWVATGGPRGTRGAVESTFLRPVTRGVVWYHEDSGVARMVSADPRLVIEQLQRSANEASQAAGGPGVRVDWVYGPETRAGLIRLANRVAPTNEQTLMLTTLERALTAAFHEGRGQVVLPALVELPTFGNDRIALSPNGHMNAMLIAQGGVPVESVPADQAVQRTQTGAVPSVAPPPAPAPPPSPAAPVTTANASMFSGTTPGTTADSAQGFNVSNLQGQGFTPAQIQQLQALLQSATANVTVQGGQGAACNPLLSLTAVVPGYDPVAWAQMSQADRFKAWERWVGDDPANRSWPSCAPGQMPSQATVSLALGQVAQRGTGTGTGTATAQADGSSLSLPSVPDVNAIQWTTGRKLAVAGGILGIGYIAYVAARELRNPSPDPRGRG